MGSLFRHSGTRRVLFLELARDVVANFLLNADVSADAADDINGDDCVTGSSDNEFDNDFFSLFDKSGFCETGSRWKISLIILAKLCFMLYAICSVFIHLVIRLFSFCISFYFRLGFYTCCCCYFIIVLLLFPLLCLNLLRVPDSGTAEPIAKTNQ